MKKFLVIAMSLGIYACSSSSENQSTSSSPEKAEPYRPEYHFTPPSMWMNDPNGMVYYNEEYHLFYQHYPDSTVWGPMHWGHAVSKDMIHWKHLPIALYPDSLGYIFSGSAVADVENTSGLGSKENPALIAIYTYHDAEEEKTGSKNHQSQGVAYSIDDGRTWKKYEKNPVIPNPGKVQDFRDPKVFWHPKSSQWKMILAVGDHVEFFTSEDLLSWEKTGEFGQQYGGHGGVWECPDLFELTVNGSSKWVMLLSINPGAPLGGSGTQYFIGDYDGRVFKSENPPETELWIDYGKDDYAGVTWSNIPESDGRRLFLGWMSNWEYAQEVPTKNWRSAMTIPRSLSLVNTQDGIRLASTPVKELNSLRTEHVAIEPRTISDKQPLSKEISFDIATSELLIKLDQISEAKEVGIELANSQNERLLVGYDVEEQVFYVDRSKAGTSDFSEGFAGKFTAPRISKEDSLTMHLYFDVASVELFADQGEVAMTDIFFPKEPFDQISIYVNGKVELTHGDLFHLKSIDLNNSPQ